MKIAFILSYPVLSSSNGIVSQGLTWKKGLEQSGHTVILVDMWQKNDWKSFDILHFFGYGVYMRDLINGVIKINKNIVVSPILDPHYGIYRLKLYSKWGIAKLGLINHYYVMSSIKDKIKLFFVRSEFEKEYMVNGYGVNSESCPVVPLSYDVTMPQNKVEKEPFCLHISLLMDDRKNVKRLVQAAVKYQFKLVLGGRIHNEEGLNTLKSWINGNKNIEYRGYLPEEEMMSLYARAKVFALPSLNEGVGIVALQAASFGCDIVITNKGGPKEYYNDMVKLVNPYSIDEIGKAINYFLKGDTFQPELSKHIKENFSLTSIAEKLIHSYKSVLLDSSVK